MSEWDSPNIHLKGKIASPEQTRHLREDLFYDGPNVLDAYEASQLISILHADPTVRARREYERRLKEGPGWLVWEKWMHQSRREYEKAQWQQWWAETRKVGHQAGIEPLQTPPTPAEWKGRNYSTVEELMAEIRQVLGLPAGSRIQLELSVENREDAIQVKSKVSEMRAGLRTIEDDAAWIAAQVRSAHLGEQLIGELFEENAGGHWRGVRLEEEQFRILKNRLTDSYANVRGVVKALKKQMGEFVKRVDEVYKK